MQFGIVTEYLFENFQIGKKNKVSRPLVTSR